MMQQTEDAFKADLQYLLNKYGAELYIELVFDDFYNAEDDGKYRMTASIPAVYLDNKCIRESTVIDLGQSISPSPSIEY